MGAGSQVSTSTGRWGPACLYLLPGEGRQEHGQGDTALHDSPAEPLQQLPLNALGQRVEEED
eukprot:9096610-Prorocentrum_lima.AAC.1